MGSRRAGREYAGENSIKERSITFHQVDLEDRFQNCDHLVEGVRKRNVEGPRHACDDLERAPNDLARMKGAKPKIR